MVSKEEMEASVQIPIRHPGIVAVLLDTSRSTTGTARMLGCWTARARQCIVDDG